MKKNNVRFLTTTLAAASLLASSSSYGLGIGEMKLKSALNQNLQAEIGLVLADGENANDFKVNLAPNEKFDEAGIPWTLFLSKIKFKIVQKNGKTIIELSSHEVLKEPFLDFLIEVKSAKGNLYREFTVLIDPPSAYQASNSAPVTTQSSDPLHFVELPTSQTSGTYLTRENETLWKIAAQFNKQNNVSVHRMVAAIFVANPDAFQKSDEHALLPNKTLKIPSFSESPELFIASEKPVPKHIPVKKVTKPAKNKPAISDKNVASEEPKTQASAEKVTEKKLSDESQQRFAELEKQLAAMQKAIADKDLEMAALKASGQIAQTVATPPVATPPVVIPPPIVPAPVSTLPTLDNVAMPATTPQPAQPIAVMPPPALPTAITPIAATPIPAPVISTPPPVVSTPAPIVSTPKTTTPIVAVGDYFGIPQELYYYAAGGVGSLLLGILGFLRLREQRKNKKDISVVIPVVDEITESEQQTETVAQTIPAKDSTDAMFDDNSFDMSNIDNSLFEDAAAGFADMVTNDNTEKRSVDDVLYKADVYCTYGNDKEAEKLLKKEFFKKTDAHDYALRLLKLYQTQDNKVDFKDFVFELVKLGKKDLPDFWSKVSDIAAEFYPEALFFMPPPAIPDSTAISTNDLFANVEVKFEDDLDFDSMSFDDVDEKEMTFGESTVEETVNATTIDNMFAGSLGSEPLAFEFDIPKTESGFEVGGFTLGESLDFTKPELKAEEMAAEEQTLDFNFGDFVVEEKLTPETIIDEPALEFNFGNFAMEDPVKTEVAAELDFGSFAMEEPVKAEVAAELDFGSFAMEEPVKTEVAAELDFGSFTMEEPVKTEVAAELDFGSFAMEEPVKAEVAAELDFGGFAMEDPVKTEVAAELDFGSFAMEEPVKAEVAAELDFGSFAMEEPVKTEVASELDFGSFAMEEPVKTEVAAELDFGSFAMEEPVKTEVAAELDFGSFAMEEPVKTEVAAELDFGSFAMEEPVKTEVADELDFGSFAMEEPVKTEVAAELDFGSFAMEEPVKTEVAAELDFGSFAMEEPVKTEVAAELDFGSFAMEEPVKTEVADELDFSGFTVAQSLDVLTTEKMETEDNSFDFTGFAEPQVFENDANNIEKDETELDFSSFAIPEEVDTVEGLDLGSFVVLETQDAYIEPTIATEKTLREKFDENESALDLAIKNFKVDEPEEAVTIVDIPKTVEPESIHITEKPFAEPSSKRPLDFDTVNELVEKRINETYIELAKVHAKEDVQIEYLDMSDSQFADSLASEVLKKCQIKEQLCRQKITQEVLSKLS